MSLTDTLLDEHKHIDRLIRCLFTATAGGEPRPSLPPDFFLAAARFIQVFADGIHHRKEEGILFPTIAPSMAKAVEALLGEHDIARGFTQNMERAAWAWQNGDDSAARETMKNARDYAALLHDHIRHENDVVYPATNWLITPAEQARMDEMVDNLNIDRHEVDQILALLDSLEAQFKKSTHD